MAQLKTDQNNLIVYYKLIFDNGLVVCLSASPLSPETGREVLGQFTEDYTMISMITPIGFSYPFLRGIPMSESYIAAQLGIGQPISSLLQAILARLTSIDLPDLILQDAEKWYSTYYQQNQQLTLVS